MIIEIYTQSEIISLANFLLAFFLEVWLSWQWAKCQNKNGQESCPQQLGFLGPLLIWAQL